MSWEQYFLKNKGRAVRPLYEKAIAHLSEFQPNQSVAVDLGCGAGIETVDLLNRGWSVTAIDGEPSSIETVMELAGLTLRKSLRTLCKRFEDLEGLPLSEFIYSYHSLPFCQPHHLDRVWEMVQSAVVPNGIFAGSFFGLNDEWVQAGRTTGVNKEKLESYLSKFDLLHFEEVDKVASTALGDPKHWHFIDVIAKKK